MAKVTLPGLIPTAFQRMVLANSTALAVNSTVRAQSKVLEFTVETGRARYRSDAAPTQGTGVLLQTSVGPYRFYDYNGTGALRFQRVNSTCIVQIQGYRYAR